LELKHFDDPTTDKYNEREELELKIGRNNSNLLYKKHEEDSLSECLKHCNNICEKVIYKAIYSNWLNQ